MMPLQYCQFGAFVKNPNGASIAEGGGGTFYDLYIFGQFCDLRQLQRILDRILPVSSELTRKIWNKVKSMCPMVTLSIFIDIASCCKQLIPFFTCFWNIILDTSGNSVFLLSMFILSQWWIYTDKFWPCLTLSTQSSSFSCSFH